MPAQNAYHNDLADFFARNADTSPYNAYTDRPAMLDLAGDVTGQRLLDVGCGAGHYAVELLARGAHVTGIDGSADLLRHARTRVEAQAPEEAHATAEFRVHDLDTPLDFAPDAAFDGAVCALVYHHVTARAQLLAELRRVLRPGGWLALSTTHPTSEWQRVGGSYYDDTWIDDPLHNPAFSIRYQRLTLEALMTELLSAGFVLERLVEPRPVPEAHIEDPDCHTRLHTRPCFLAFRLRSP